MWVPRRSRAAWMVSTSSIRPGRRVTGFGGIKTPLSPFRRQVELGGQRLKRVADDGDYLANLLARDDHRRRHHEIVAVETALDLAAVDDQPAFIGEVEQALGCLFRRS